MTRRRPVTIPSLDADTWNGYVKGDPVRVLGTQGKWTFQGARLSDTGDAQWVTVIGGAGSVHQFRSFLPHRIASAKPSKAPRAPKLGPTGPTSQVCPCGNVIPRTGKRGRPPTKCPTCRGVS